MSRFVVHELICYECRRRDKLTLSEAKRQRWQVWRGGGRCADCGERRELKRRKMSGRRG